MKKVIVILVFGTLLGACVAYGQVAKSFPAGSPVADKANLLKIYSGIETQVPKWKTEAKAMQPYPEDSYAVGKMVEISQKDLLKALNDLHDTLDAARREDFENPWEVAFIECRVRDDLEEVSDNFDLYAASLDSSSVPKAQADKIIMQQALEALRTRVAESRVLRIDLENRLHDMAVMAEKRH